MNKGRKKQQEGVKEEKGFIPSKHFIKSQLTTIQFHFQCMKIRMATILLNSNKSMFILIYSGLIVSGLRIVEFCQKPINVENFNFSSQNDFLFLTKDLETHTNTTKAKHIAPMIYIVGGFFK